MAKQREVKHNPSSLLPAASRGRRCHRQREGQDAQPPLGSNRYAPGELRLSLLSTRSCLAVAEQRGNGRDLPCAFLWAPSQAEAEVSAAGE